MITLEDCVAMSGLTLDEVDAIAEHEHIPEAGTVPLCGNSIGTDRRFLARFLPDIENYLHYRRRCVELGG